MPANPFGLFTNFLGSQAGGLLANLYAGSQYNNLFNRFQSQQVDPINAAAQNQIAGLGGINALAGNNFNQALQLVNNSLDPEQQQARYNQAFNPISKAYGELPGQVGGIAQNASTQFGSDAANINRGLGGALAGFGAQAGQISGQLGGAASLFGSEAGAINAGYQAQLERARGLVGGLSDQDRRDVLRRGEQQSATLGQNLASRGLGGTTVLPALQRGLTEDRDAELRRVSDQRINQLLGVESSFGNAALGARAGLATTGLQAAQNQAGILGNLAQTGLTGGLNAAATSGNLAQTAFSGGLNRAGLAADVGLNSLAARGNIAGGSLSARDNAILQRLGVLDLFGNRPIQTGLNTSGLALGYYGQPILTPPSPFLPFSIQPRGR